MDRFYAVSIWLGSPDFADAFVVCESVQRLEPTCEVVSIQGVAEMATKLIVAVLVIPLSRGVFDCPVHLFDLPIGTGMVGLCQAMFDIIRLTN